jgi:hypothetical protein
MEAAARVQRFVMLRPISTLTLITRACEAPIVPCDEVSETAFAADGATDFRPVTHAIANGDRLLPERATKRPGMFVSVKHQQELIRGFAQEYF